MPCPGYIGQPSVHSRINPNVPSTSRGVSVYQRVGISPQVQNQPERSFYARIGWRGRDDYPSWYYDKLNYINNILHGGSAEEYFQQLDRDSQLMQECNWSAQGFPEDNNDEQCGITTTKHNTSKHKNMTYKQAHTLCSMNFWTISELNLTCKNIYFLTYFVNSYIENFCFHWILNL